MDPTRAYYVVIGVVVATVIWVLFKAAPIRQKNDFDEPIAPPREKTNRDELIEARERVTRQIEILQNSGRSRGSFSRENMEELKTILAEIEEELASEPS